MQNFTVNAPPHVTVEEKPYTQLGFFQYSLRPILASYAKSSISTFLNNAIQHGRLCIEDPDGTVEYGDKSTKVKIVTVRVHHKQFWTRVLLSGDLGFGEAYMLGEIEVDDLKAAMNLWLANHDNMTRITSTFGRITALISGLSNAIIGQTHSRARLNAIASYDQSNDLFQAFLSREMMYSCALWNEEEGGTEGDLTSGPTPDDLETAQRRKILNVLEKARIKQGSRLLEFGSGWGGLAIEAARTYDCEVDSLTLSVEQKTLAEKRVKEAGLEGRVRIHLLDYRDVPPEFCGAFDAFVSIEMLEHVGVHYYKEYFKIVDSCLKPHGTVVVSASTYPEVRYSHYQAEDFMRRYMWPNSCLPSATTLINAAYQATNGRFMLESVENHAAHYPRTLRTWGRRLAANLEQEVMAQSYPSLDDATEFAIFKRKWEYFFAYAETGFLKGHISCHMLTFTRS